MRRVLDQGVPAGNWEDKQNATNPIARWLYQNFLDSIKELLVPLRTEIGSIVEVGCGEGNITLFLSRLDLASTIKGCDFSEKIIAVARDNAKATSLEFYSKDIYHIDEQEQADLIVCCEVLEHLEVPEMAIEKLVSVTNKYCLLSVPNEPVWRVLNICRGKYIKDFGNTPGHLNHWSSRRFVEIMSKYFDVVSIKKPLPWTMILCRKKKGKA